MVHERSKRWVGAKPQLVHGRGGSKQLAGLLWHGAIPSWPWRLCCCCCWAACGAQGSLLLGPAVQERATRLLHHLTRTAVRPQVGRASAAGMMQVPCMCCCVHARNAWRGLCGRWRRPSLCSCNCNSKGKAARPACCHKAAVTSPRCLGACNGPRRQDADDAAKLNLTMVSTLFQLWSRTAVKLTGEWVAGPCRAAGLGWAGAGLPSFFPGAHGPAYAHRVEQTVGTCGALPCGADARNRTAAVCCVVSCCSFT